MCSTNLPFHFLISAGHKCKKRRNKTCQSSCSHHLRELQKKSSLTRGVIIINKKAKTISLEVCEEEPSTFSFDYLSSFLLLLNDLLYQHTSFIAQMAFLSIATSLLTGYSYRGLFVPLVWVSFLPLSFISLSFIANIY